MRSLNLSSLGTESAFRRLLLKRYAAPDTGGDWRGVSEDEGGSRLSEQEAIGAEDRQAGLRARGEEALGDLAQALLENPLLNQALTKALGAGERAVQAQRSAMGALNIPAASDLERLEQRIRSLSNRLESIEDRLDEVIDDVAVLRRRLSDAEPGPSEGGEQVSASEAGEE